MGDIPGAIHPESVILAHERVPLLDRPPDLRREMVAVGESAVHEPIEQHNPVIRSTSDLLDHIGPGQLTAFAVQTLQHVAVEHFGDLTHSDDDAGVF